MSTQAQTAAYFTTTNTLLASGDVGIESDSGDFKVGDGIHRWANLPYSKSSFRPSASGIYMPNPGALDRWKAARANAANQLVEVAMMGDSVWWGQTGTGDNAGSANNVQAAQMLRALSIGAGYPDGGVGVRGFDSSAGMSGRDNLAPVQSQTPGGSFGVQTYGTAGNYGLLANKSVKTLANTGNSGASIVMQGYGLQARLVVAVPPSSYATQAPFTYSVNGGSAVAQNPSQSASTANIYTIPISGLNPGVVNTITVALTGAGTLEFTIEWLNTTGIVWHAYCQPGQSLARRWDYTGVQVEPFASAVSLGLWENTPFTVASSIPFEGVTTSAQHKPALAMLNLGINDFIASSGSAGSTAAQQSTRNCIANFAQSCDTAGVDALVCIPHLLYSGSAANVKQFLGDFRSAILAAGSAYGLPVVDLQVPLGNYNNLAALWGNTSPHLNAAAYVAQASFLWNNLLGL